jgi:hypothetical protein
MCSLKSQKFQGFGPLGSSLCNPRNKDKAGGENVQVLNHPVRQVKLKDPAKRIFRPGPKSARARMFGCLIRALSVVQGLKLG